MDDFLIIIAKVIAMSLLVDLIKKPHFNSKDKSLYKVNFDKKDLININKNTK